MSKRSAEHFEPGSYESLPTSSLPEEAPRTYANRQRVVPVHSILIPLDGSSIAELALPHAARLASLLKCRLVLLIVKPAVGMGWDTVTEELLDKQDEDKVRPYLEEQVEKIDRAGMHAEYMIRSGEPIEAICDIIREQRIDFVVMTTHGRSSLRRALVGSVTDGVLRQSPVPVMVVRPGQQAPLEFASLATHEPVVE